MEWARRYRNKHCMGQAPIHRLYRNPAVVALVLGVALASGCASAPAGQAGSGAEVQSTEVAELALELRGEPYRFGGERPGGFDCSGLVHYVYQRAGIEVPRTARGQYEAVRQRYRDQLAPGDLLFFGTDGVFVSHVGIYVGDGQFVHALKPGEPVKVARLDKRYWSRRLVRAGTLAP